MTTTTEIHHYDAATARKGFLTHALPMHRFPLQVWQSRDLVWNFFRRELLGQFRGSLGGIFWVLIQPVFQFVIYFTIFGIVMAPRDALQSSGPDPFFAFYLFSGILMFNAILGGTNGALRSVLTNGNLVKKVRFPSELLPLTPVLVATVVYMVGCVVMLLIGLFFGQVSITPALLAWPVLIVCLVVFTTGLGLLLAGANVFMRDVSHLYGIIGQAWFFMTPVFWRLPMIEGKAIDFGVPWVMDLMLLNPAYCLLMAQRQVFGMGHYLSPEEYQSYFPMGLGGHLAFSAGWALLAFFIGYGFFMSRRRKFADLV